MQWEGMEHISSCFIDLYTVFCVCVQKSSYEKPDITLTGCEYDTDICLLWLDAIGRNHWECLAHIFSLETTWAKRKLQRPETPV